MNKVLRPIIVLPPFFILKNRSGLTIRYLPRGYWYSLFATRLLIIIIVSTTFPRLFFRIHITHVTSVKHTPTAWSPDLHVSFCHIFLELVVLLIVCSLHSKYIIVLLAYKVIPIESLLGVLQCLCSIVYTKPTLKADSDDTLYTVSQTVKITLD